MISKTKQRSSNFSCPLASLLFLTLAGFFVYAAYSNVQFFNVLFYALLVSLSFLLILRFKLTRRQAAVTLQEQDLSERNNLLTAEIQREKDIINSFKEKIVNYSKLKNVVESLGANLSLAETAQTLTAESSRLFGNGEDITVILYLLHLRSGELALLASQKGGGPVGLKLKKGDIFDSWVIKNLQPLLVEDTKRDFRFDADKMPEEGSRVIRSLISVPLVIGNKTIGILRVDSGHPHKFRTEDLRILTAIGDVGAVAIENAQLYEHVQDLAIRDSLTGLYLRRYVLERMSQEMSRELRIKKELSFLMIDLDKFKKYNDQFGHMAGDIVLRTVAMILADYFKQAGNLVCRYGGEEFVVLLPDCSKEKALELAENIRKRIEGQDIILRREKTPVTVSIGVATFPRDAQLKDEIIQKADEALYQAKQKGRNQVFAA